MSFNLIKSSVNIWQPYSTHPIIFGNVAMEFYLTSSSKKELNRQLKRAELCGDIRWVKRILVILALCDGYSYTAVANFFKVSTESVRLWLRDFLLGGVKALSPKKSPGRPAKLTKTQRHELAEIIESGPNKAGFPGYCWRSPMIQHMIYEKFGVFYSTKYVSELLKNMGFSFQKARFESDHLNTEKRKEWLEEKWPGALALAKQKDALSAAA